MKNSLLRELTFAVIGGGHGGQGIAGYLALLGYRVNLYNRTLDNIMDIVTKGYIDLEGVIEGRGRLNLVTNSLELAIRGADIIMVVLPANAHRYIAEKIAPFITQDQYIVLNPGRTGGALEFRAIIKAYNPLKSVSIVEAQTLLFACRSIGDGKVKIFSKKEAVRVSALPAIRTMDFIDKINEAIPEFIPATNVLETSFNNVGAMLHPIPTILNCGRIESTQGDFQYYIEGITPSVANVIEQADKERMSVARALGIRAISLREWLGYTYNAHGDNLCEALRNTVGYWGIKAPSTIETRYIFEDVPESLVPISDMGRHLGIHTFTIDSMIHLASVIHNTNYYVRGRTVRKMGIEGLSTDEILNLVINGDEISNEGVVA